LREGLDLSALMEELRSLEGLAQMLMQ